MPRLPVIHHVEDFVRSPSPDAIIDRGQIGGHVVEPAVALTDECRHVHPLPVPAHQERILLGRQCPIAEHRNGSIAQTRDARRQERLHHGTQLGVVKTLTQGVVKPSAHPPVERVELNLREADHLLPDRQVLGVTGLQAHQFLTRHFQASRVGVALGVDRLVQPLHFGDGIALQSLPIQQFLPAHQQFAELGAPVTNVIVTNDPVPEQSPHPLQRFPDARGSDVPDMHGLGDVRRREIQNHCPRRLGLGYEHRFPAGCVTEPLLQGLSCQSEIQKSWAGNFNGLTNIGDVEARHHIAGQLAGIHAGGLRHQHQGVALKITKPRLGGRLHLNGGRVGGRNEGGNRGAEPGFKDRMEHGTEGSDSLGNTPTEVSADLRRSRGSS